MNQQDKSIPFYSITFQLNLFTIPRPTQKVSLVMQPVLYCLCLFIFFRMLVQSELLSESDPQLGENFMMELRKPVQLVMKLKTMSSLGIKALILIRSFTRDQSKQIFLTFVQRTWYQDVLQGLMQLFWPMGRQGVERPTLWVQVAQWAYLQKWWVQCLGYLNLSLRSWKGRSRSQVFLNSQ